MLGTNVYYTLDEEFVYGNYDWKQDLLNEDFYGKQKVKPIQDAMDAIAKKVWKDPMWRVQDTKEAYNLEQAICKVFGFRRCSIYWRYTNPTALNVARRKVLPELNVRFSGGGFTVPSLVLIPDQSAKSPTNYGNSKTGFYDNSHTISCAIVLNQGYFSDMKLSSEELVGVILHEIGHNFDNTVFKLMQSWRVILIQLFGLTNRISDRVSKGDIDPAAIAGDTIGTLGGAIMTTMLPKVSPEFATIAHTIDDMLITSIPTFASVYKGITNIAAGALAVANTVMTPWYIFKMILALPARFMVAPIRLLSSAGTWFLTNKSETYADSFAAQYGYGLEVNAGLRKMSQGYAGEFEIFKKTPVDVILRPFYDIVYLDYEFFSAIDGHGDNVERWKRMLATLDQDLQMSGLNSADKKLIIAERDRIKAEYEKYMKMDEDRKYILTSLYHKAVECWYRGESHGFIKTFMPDKTYAQ